MSRKYISVMLIPVLILLIGCPIIEELPTLDELNNANYWPTSVGTTWTRRHVSRSSGDTYYSTISIIASSGGTISRKIELTNTTGYIIQTFQQSGTSVKLKEIETYDSLNNKLSTITYSSPCLSHPSSMSIDTYESQICSYTINSTEYTKKIETRVIGFDDISVSIGSFRALRIDTTTTPMSPNPGSPTTTTGYLADGIGAIKLLSSSTETELISFSN